MEMKESIIFFNNVTSRALLSFPVETGALIVNRSMYRQEKTKAEKTSPFFFFFVFFPFLAAAYVYKWVGVVWM